jgi:hypothetical protein
MPVNTTNASSNASPLWIIALFIALSEAMASVASIETDGTARLIFAIFAVSFPVLVLVIFVGMLLLYPANLYSPSQYTAQTTVETYARTLRRERRDNALVLKHAVSEAVSQGSAGIELPLGASPSRDALRDQVAEIFEHVMSESSVTVDPSPLLEGADPIQVPVTSNTTVAELLDSIYFSISPAVEPFTYNKSWVLADTNLAPLNDIGTLWARARGSSRDDRTLKEAGIAPASELVVLPQHRLARRQG